MTVKAISTLLTMIIAIQCFTSEGTFFFQFGTSQLCHPSDLFFDPIYHHLSVVGNGNHRICLFDLLSSFGSHGRREGQFHYPWGEAIDGQGSIYVTEFDNHRVQVFTKVIGKGELGCPMGVDLLSNRDVGVADFSSSGISIFSPQGNLVQRMERGREIVNPLASVC